MSFSNQDNLKSEIISKKDKKSEDINSFLISEYEKYNISSPNLFLYTCLLLTSYFLYLKVNDKFIALWRVTFYPLYLYLIVNSLLRFYLIIKTDSLSSTEKEKEYLSGLQIPNLSNIYVISNFYKFVLYLLIICFIYNIHSFLDIRDDNFLFASLKFLIIACLWSILYSILRKMPQLKIKESLNIEKSNSYIVAFISSLIGPFLTYLSNMLIICNGGACTQIYMSTITSLLGAFGVTLSEVSKYMFPITCILLGISLLSLFYKKRSFTHKPFLLGIFAAGFILVGKYYEKTKIKYLTYPGNILMIAAAIWNVKINKFSGLPVYYNQQNKKNKE